MWRRRLPSTGPAGRTLSGLALAVLLGLAGCGGGSSGTPDVGAAPEVGPDAPAADSVAPGSDGGGASGDVTDRCSQCAADEICVQLNDSSAGCRISVPNLVCQVVSDACRAQLSQISISSPSCFQVSAECQREFCTSPYQCVQAPPCGNETTRAVVWCYGP